jgi:hypothetical protein
MTGSPQAYSVGILGGDGNGNEDFFLIKRSNKKLNAGAYDSRQPGGVLIAISPLSDDTHATRGARRQSRHEHIGIHAQRCLIMLADGMD